MIQGAPIIYANAAFEELTGYTATEIIGKNCNVLAGPETAPEMSQRMGEAMAENRSFRGIMLNYRKDGSQFWNDVTIVPVDDGPDARYFVGVQVDVTERLALEASLRESQKMEALGKLSGGIAHDFNNILALVMGNAELIMTEAMPGSVMMQAATDIVEAADGGSHLVSRMLQFARGQSEVAEAVSVNDVVRDVVALLSRTMGDSRRFDTDLSAAVGTVAVDKTLFETAIINLALNARDATPSGETIRIQTRRRANAGPGLENAAVVSVIDTGHGMEEEVRRRAFEPFFTTKQAGDGSGLGLSMVYRFVQQSGGDVVIDSAPGYGTTVNLLLPLKQPSPAARTDDAIAAATPRVLVVEDDGGVRKVLALHLSRAGYVVDEAANAAEAMALVLGDQAYDLVISDIRMGESMTGIDLVAAIRAERPGIPMLLITGFADELEAPPSHIDGVPILYKPFKMKELIETVARMRSGISIVG
jgi:PAS domain S-box-containing protein